MKPIFWSEPATDFFSSSRLRSFGWSGGVSDRLLKRRVELTGHVEDYRAKSAGIHLQSRDELTFGSHVNFLPLEASLLDGLASLLLCRVNLGGIDVVNTTL